MSPRVDRLLLLALAAALAAACATVTEKDRVSARLHYDLGVAAMQQGRLPEALAELAQAEQLNPYFPEVHNALGYAYHQRGRAEQSEQHYRRALELNPQFSEALNNLGALLLDLGRFPEAVECFSSVLADIAYPSPQFAEGHLGYAYHRLGRHDEAVRHLKNAIATDPKFCRGYLWLAEVFRAQGRSAQEVAALERFIKTCVEHPETRAQVNQGFIDQARHDLGQALVRAGDSEGARRQFEQCVAEADGLSGVGQRCREALATTPPR